MKFLWNLPVPSTALLGIGPTFREGAGRQAALSFSYEGNDDATISAVLVFRGVEAYKCTYYLARGSETLQAYAKLIDVGASAWLSEIRANLKTNGGAPEGLVHLMINFDDGPAYEFICRSFEVKEE